VTTLQPSDDDEDSITMAPNFNDDEDLKPGTKVRKLKQKKDHLKMMFAVDP
jgi:hypothetical protein